MLKILQLYSEFRQQFLNASLSIYNVPATHIQQAFLNLPIEIIEMKWYWYNAVVTH